MKKRIIALCLTVVCLTGCATVEHKASITIGEVVEVVNEEGEVIKNEQVITFISPKKEDMTYKKTAAGDVEITYSSQSRSLLARFVGAVSSWVAGIFTRRVEG